MKRGLLMVLLLGPTWALAGEQTLSQASYAGSPLTMMSMLAVMSLLPFAVLMLTSFSKIAVVLSLARSAMGTQQAPPSIVLTGLAAVLSAHIMAPTLERVWESGSEALARHEAGSGAQLLSSAATAVEPLREFLVRHGTDDERARFVDLARELRPPEQAEGVSERDWMVVVP